MGEFTYNRRLMAQALSVVGEHGVHGFSYNGLIESWENRPNSRQSRRFRVSISSAYRFSGDEFENYLILAWRFGFLKRSKYKESDLAYGENKSAYPVGNEIVQLTREGWEFIDDNDTPILHRWWANILENLPTLVISILSALFVSWALYKWGAPLP